MQLDKNKIMVAGVLGSVLIGAYTLYRNKKKEEEVQEAGGGGGSTSTSGSLANKGSTSTTTNNADLGSTSQSPTNDTPKQVIADAKKLTKSHNREGNKVNFSYNSGTKQTKIKDSSGETIGIYDYKKKISTTPKLQKNSSSSSGGSSSSSSSTSQEKNSSQLNYTPVSKNKEEKEEKKISSITKPKSNAEFLTDITGGTLL